MSPQQNRQEDTGGVPESQIRAQLAQILASETFVKSERLTGFLRFVVERTLEGNAASLKEQVLVSELYGRGADFDTRADPVVRVDARRLRDKLREYYAEHPQDPVLIAVPKGAYVPVFEPNPSASPTVQAPAGDVEAGILPTRARTVSNPKILVLARLSVRRMVLILSVVAVIAAAAWVVSLRRQEQPSALKPLTALPGNEGEASLSPDGNFVAFACTAPDPSAQSDICIKAVGTEVVERVAETPAPEYWPRWSPDSREILFGRGPIGSAPAYQEFGQEQGIFIVSRMGGPERQISDTGAIAAWAPDGKSVLIRDRLAKDDPYGIFQMDLATSTRLRLTKPPIATGDGLFDVSPDGRRLAFIRAGRPGLSDLYISPIEGEGRPPRRVTDWNRALDGVAWMPDGKELIYSLDGRLWRISADLPSPGRGSPIQDVPMQASGVTISRPAAGQPVRLAFQTFRQQISFRRIDLHSAVKDGSISGIFQFAPTTRSNVSPGRFSPDGSKVAFASNRGSESLELWVAASDGSNPQQLTSFGAASGMLVGGWSPDGKRVLFDTAIDGNHDVYVISVDGGQPVKLTTSPSIDLLADWSPDGRWIYYTSGNSGVVSNIWRIPAGGGSPEPVTTKGGFNPQFSGESLYYVDRLPQAGLGRLMKMPVAGGDPQQVLEEVHAFRWCVSDEGIYLLRPEGHEHSLHQYRFSDKRTVRVGRLPLRIAGNAIPGRLVVSRDGRWAVVNVAAPREGDLMLLDNFR